MRKCFPSRVWKSSVPLSVMTNCLMGASCQAKAPPEAVSSNEIVVVAILPLSMSPRCAGLKVDDALLEMRVPVISRPYSYTPDHGPAPVFAAAFALRDSGPAAAERGSVGRNGTTVAWSRMAYTRLQGCSPSSFQSWPATVSSVNKMSPARSEKRPSCVVNSSAPLSVMTSCRAGSGCHPSFGSAVRLLE